MTKGHLLKYGKVHHKPNNQSSVDEYINVVGGTTLPSKLHRGSFIFNVKIQQKMYSEAKLLVYYVRDDREIIGTNIKINVEECVSNKVKNIKFPFSTFSVFNTFSVLVHELMHGLFNTQPRSKDLL